MIRILTTIFIFALLMGCIDNYDMKEAGGKLYRMNKRTGEVDIVEGNSITPITTMTAKDKQAMEWVKTHSNDDSLYYKYSNPATGTIREGYRFLGGNQTDSTRWEPVHS